jgi:hypothetical protein
MNWSQIPPPSAVSWPADKAPFRKNESRQFQLDFYTLSHSVEGASILRRPDAISLDYLTAHTLGPIAVADPSRGLVARVWKAWTPDGFAVWLAGANGAGDAWTDERLLFTITDGGPPIVELDMAFEQNGQPVVCLERPTGTGGAPEVWIWFFDPTVPGMVLRNFGPGRTPRALLDRPMEIADSDVLVFYVADHAGRIAYRQQRDRYALEILTPAPADENTFVEDVAKAIDRRLHVIYSVRDPATGTYALARLVTTLFPSAMETEGLEPAHSLTMAELRQVIFDLSVQAEGLEPAHSLTSVQLRDLIILYAPMPEGLEPAHSLSLVDLRNVLIVYPVKAPEGLSPEHSLTSVTMILQITIDRDMVPEGVEPAHSLTSVQLVAV